MKSQILGKLTFDEELLERSINKILQFEFTDAYSDFAIGEWKFCVLWNHSGCHDDTTFHNYEGQALLTEFGKQLEYINLIINETFNINHINWVRAFYICEGLLIPHRDYLELKTSFIRVHIPLKTTLKCLNSDGNVVFHMRKGEIWFLDAAQPHSVCNFSNIPKISLCIDFKAGIPLCEVFKDRKRYTPGLSPHLVQRKVTDKQYIEAIRGLAHLICEENFNDIVSLLSKVHFVKNEDVATMFDWLINITQSSGNKQLIEKALAMEKFYLKQRSFGEVCAR